MAADSGPRRGGHDDIVMTDDEDQIDRSTTPVLESDHDMSIKEQPAAPAAVKSRPDARQREPAVDEDDLPLDDAEDSASKRRRLGQILHQKLAHRDDRDIRPTVTEEVRARHPAHAKAQLWQR